MADVSPLTLVFLVTKHTLLNLKLGTYATHYKAVSYMYDYKKAMSPENSSPFLNFCYFTIYMCTMIHYTA
jgi:hypothetical protein